MNELSRFVKRADNLHISIAGDVFPGGARLVCRDCGQVQQITTNDAAFFLAHGWPKCCGHTMSLVNMEPPAPPSGSASK
jgi:hypothetical protein